jgi:UDP-N-acetylglucosamine 1-carboxyvinyltransferase
LPVSAVELAGIRACADMSTMTGLLRAAGWPVSQCDDRGRVRVGGLTARGRYPDLAGAAAIRASYYLIAPLIAGYGHATLPWPGGCRVGDRGMDLHFCVYEAFGDHAEVSPAGYTVRSSRVSSRGTVRVDLPFRSRGATVAAALRARACLSSRWRI